MVFTAKPVGGLPNFGDKIKGLREEAGLTLEKIAQLTGFQLKHLEWLENNELEKLPADVYTKGFLRKYARVLDIEPEKLIADYENEARITRHLSKNQAHQSLPTLKYRRFIITPKTISLFFGLIVLLLVVGYLFYQLHFLISPPGLTVFEPPNDLITYSDKLFIKGQTEPGAKLTINGQQSYIDKDGQFSQEITLNQGLNNIRVDATNRFGKVSAEARRVMLK